MAKIKKFVLTEKEQKFAEDNHNIIYDFLHRNRLQISEFYDIAAIGFLRAVRAWHREPGLKEKYKFYTTAWHGMRSCVGNEFESVKRRKLHETTSLDSLTESGTRLVEIMEDTNDSLMQFEQEMELHELLELVATGLTERQRRQLIAKVLGYKRKDIVEFLGISISTYKRDKKTIEEAVAAVRRAGHLQTGQRI